MKYCVSVIGKAPSYTRKFDADSIQLAHANTFFSRLEIRWWMSYQYRLSISKKWKREILEKTTLMVDQKAIVKVGVSSP